MVQTSLRAAAALLPVLFTILQANALIFELSPHANKRQTQHHRIAQKAKRAAPVLPATWAYLGCYTDGAARSLPAFGTVSATMTVDTCVALCDSQNYLYAGLEYSQECYCDNSIQNGGAAAADGCNMMCAGDATQTCGGGYRLSVYKSSKSLPAPLPSYNTWGYQGCYTDNTAARSLTVPMAVTGGMTPQKCLDACRGAGYTYAGMEYSVECYCGNAITNGGVAVTDGCTMTCAGNTQYICGGGNRLTLYKYGAAPVSSSTTTTTTSASTSTSTSTRTSTSTVSTVSSSTPSATPTGPITVPSYNGWTSRGCYVDSVANRALPVAMGVTGGAAAMTVEKCLDACKAAGYTFAGLEYAQECFCGSAMPTTAQATDGRCSMVCNGNNLEYCGGGNGLNLYSYGAVTSTSTSTAQSTQTTTTTSRSSTSTSTTPSATPTGPSVLATYGNWQSQGCWSDNPAARSLPVALAMNGAATVQKCADACYNAGYSYAGLEYAAECYCGSAVQNGGTVQDNSGCNMVCQADNLHYCGGPNRLNLYKYNGVVPTPTNPPPGGGGGGGGGGVTPLTTGLPGTWTYNACWVDNAYGRIFSLAQPASQTNSALSCISQCSAAGYKVAGLQYGNECWCGNHLQNAAVKATSEADCNMACPGDTTHACGGPNRLNVYAATATFPVYPVPTIKKANLPGSYQYLGCYAEAPGGLRVFDYLIESQTATTIDGCLNLCSSYGYPAASLEFGTQCFCGDPSQITTAQAPDGDCNIACTGSPTDYCGGVGKLLIYTWNMATNPLFVWNKPANTGRYELLIGGIVIPLIATLGINNKVNFMEKYGTGAPNSTGAYELDYSLANDYKKAWREMHVSSDVFCAANIVLPDRKGRILSVGGWSLDSTRGVRFYTPSGSPGVNGTTDWEEVYDSLHLQQGRWYPGAMVMANGSVLVVGGEEGSNGKPVPTLEILPKPAGGPTYLYMDWLFRTDPNNLYPFTYTMPAGGILVIYYNEARILDETTFATIRTLPTIPAAVNAAGGRTYPMSGVSMILPQKAPYTAPIEIIVCGGSSFGIALDNCASIQPEVAGAQWVLERMPTKRVMPLMVALPDGTYWIGGGAQQGVAGFGLAVKPNLQAQIYDPSQPRGKRFSILGSTSVARLYHSEAILLHDGRILVTGSDPQDNTNPQEYRMEVYVPPYLSSGLPQPSFTIATRDWVYGGQYQITVTLRTGTTSTMRVSLIGASSTTHGAVFGQRTFFPAFTCAGNVCTITAPPSVRICPLGWYQLFVLDGPTPSYSQWVRIGGDLAGLGNWPNAAGFTLPGVGAI
ncbi:related to glyoxal oxidase precursor [Serendipita indica DSM 11827]|uniref:Related to glyoxal oxidase n=1 Tax=Serendipita indica (strain DSM 11827) TaxID=1109443 RepID=G4TMN7_SERID|nr:related to glyoxal oxidase precursor [Serendipita indica DSM 11827]